MFHIEQQQQNLRHFSSKNKAVVHRGGSEKSFGMFRVIMFIVYNNNARAEKSKFPRAKLCLSIRILTQIPSRFQRDANCSVVPPKYF